MSAIKRALKKEEKQQQTEHKKDKANQVCLTWRYPTLNRDYINKDRLQIL